MIDPGDLISLTFTVCQNEDDDNLSQSFLGRIGVSLMLRYHKTRQWDKVRNQVDRTEILQIYNKKSLYRSEIEAVMLASGCSSAVCVCVLCRVGRWWRCCPAQKSTTRL